MIAKAAFTSWLNCHLPIALRGADVSADWNAPGLATAVAVYLKMSLAEQASTAVPALTVAKIPRSKSGDHHFDPKHIAVVEQVTREVSAWYAEWRDIQPTFKKAKPLVG